MAYFTACRRHTHATPTTRQHHIILNVFFRRFHEGEISTGKTSGITSTYGWWCAAILWFWKSAVKVVSVIKNVCLYHSPRTSLQSSRGVAILSLSTCQKVHHSSGIFWAGQSLLTTARLCGEMFRFDRIYRYLKLMICNGLWWSLAKEFFEWVWCVPGVGLRGFNAMMCYK